MSRRYDSLADRYGPLGWTALIVGTLMIVILFGMATAYAGTKMFRQPTEYDVCIQHGNSFIQNEHGMSCIED